MLARTAVFTHLVKDHMSSAPVVVSQATTCRGVVEQMRRGNASSAIVKDRSGRPIGIVTEHDIVQRITFIVDPDTPVESVMSTPVYTIEDDDYLFHAIARMRRHNLRHMPVIDHHGHAVGVLQQHKAFAATCNQLIGQIDRLSHSDTLDGMKHTKEAQASVAEELFLDRVPAPDIQALLTHINNDLYERIVELCLHDMNRDGWGYPPVNFEVIVMGSGGRGESFMNPDQDNGFLLADYPDSEHARIDRWFIELAERMTKSLNEVGFDFCNGHVMATNPLWRKTLSQWKNQTKRWVGKGAGTVLRLCDIFFDFISVYGDETMSIELRTHITNIARRPHFLREMYKVDEDHGVALGLFGRLQVDQEKGPNRGKVNLKTTGMLPLVGAVRLFALREGIPAVSTRDRLLSLRERKILSQNEYDYLLGAFVHITNLLLRQQIQDFKSGIPVSKHVSPNVLTHRDRDMLIDSFKAVRTFRSRVRSELTADIF